MPKISELPVETVITGDDVLPIVDTTSTTTKQVTVASVLAYINANAMITQDQVAPAYAVGLALTGASLVEVGQTITTPGFSATYTRTPAAAVLTDTDGTAPKNVISTPSSFSSNATFVKNTYGQSVTFTLTANEAGGPSRTAAASITWAQRVYYGVAVAGAYTEAFIKALPTSTITTSLGRTFSVTAGATQRIYYAFRSAYGVPTFSVGGFTGGFHLAASGVSVTNAAGFTETYNVWESDNVNLGATTVGVS
jgi:hypothetical protein